jgi:glucokinase-like ROK family protein
MATAPDDQLESLERVLELLRTGKARTRAQLTETTGLGRAVITERLAHLRRSGLLEDGVKGESTGGRAPRELNFRAGAGVILAAEIGATGFDVGITDLAGKILSSSSLKADVTDGPDAVLTSVEKCLADLLADTTDAPTWGVGVGLPGPVEFATGRPSSPPIMPGWDDYPVRERLRARFGAPVWVDNDVNLLALGEQRAGSAAGEPDFIYLKIGTGIGAGLISGGRPHRGSLGCAGDVGHVAVAEESDAVCRCGNVGCLEALAGGAALAQQGAALAVSGRSPYLADMLRRTGRVTAEDVGNAARHGDRAAVELIVMAGRHIGATLATMVSFFNPSVVFVGGQVAEIGDVLINAIRQVVYRRSLPLATRDLRIVRSAMGKLAGVAGASAMVADALFAADALGRWMVAGSPSSLSQG